MKIIIPAILSTLLTQTFSAEPKKLTLPSSAIERNSFYAGTDVNDRKQPYNEVLIRFITESPSEPYSIGEDIFYLDTDNFTKHKGKLLKQGKEFINEGEYGKRPGGIGSILNLSAPPKDDTPAGRLHREYKHYVAFLRFNEEKVKFCDIQKDYKDEVLKPLIEKYRDPLIKKDNLNYTHIESIKFDDKNLIVVNQSFENPEAKSEADNHLNETLFFEKEKNTYKFLSKTPLSESVQLCLQEKGNPTWKFLVDDREEYSGEKFWAEFKNNQFKSYYEVEAWAD